MNKFVIKTLLFCIPILVFIVLIEITLRNIPNDYSYKKNYLDQHSKEIEVLFLGSSHAYFGINPEYIHSNSFNAAQVSQSLDYDLEILKKYEKRLTKLKYIFVPIDYFSFHNRLETGIENWRIKNYNIYFDINKGFHFQDKIEILNGSFDNNRIRIADFYNYGKSDLSCNILGWGTISNSKNAQDLIETGKAAAERHTKKEKSFFNENLTVLNEIIAIAKSKNAEVIIYTSPAYITYTSRLNNVQLQNTIDTIKSVQKANSNVSYFNFLCLSVLTPKYFVSLKS